MFFSAPLFFLGSGATLWLISLLIEGFVYLLFSILDIAGKRRKRVERRTEERSQTSREMVGMLIGVPEQLDQTSAAEGSRGERAWSITDLGLGDGWCFAVFRFNAFITCGECTAEPVHRQSASPFEGCVYREWTATRRITLYDEPQGKHVVGHLRPGEHVMGITGEIRCTALRVVAASDRFSVHHYLGRRQHQRVVSLGRFRHSTRGATRSSHSSHVYMAVFR
jgi:hypothetical protein